MKWKKTYDLEEEPNDCNGCSDEWNGHHIVEISIGNRLKLRNIGLCNKCFKKLEALK